MCIRDRPLQRGGGADTRREIKNASPSPPWSARPSRHRTCRRYASRRTSMQSACCMLVGTLPGSWSARAHRYRSMSMSVGAARVVHRCALCRGGARARGTAVNRKGRALAAAGAYGITRKKAVTGK
eukprot:6313335-Prymnesium_polylepis.2